MDIVSVKRWQWLLIGLVVGLALWGMRRWTAADLGRLGDAMNDSLTFEKALTEKPKNVDAFKFKDVRVYRETLTDESGGLSKTVHVVAGMYCDGTPDPRDGSYRWRPKVFIAPIPYRPATYLPNVADDVSVARFEKLQSATVVDFLKLLKESRGVAYRHAWWNTYPAFTWLGGSVVLIGLVWPTAINLIVFRSLFRPREEKGTDLSKVKGTTATAGVAAGAEMTEEELERLRRLEEELAAGLAGAPPTEAAPAAAPAPLSAEPVAAAAAAPGEEADFAAGPEDFYPTELHAPHAPRKPQDPVH